MFTLLIFLVNRVRIMAMIPPHSPCLMALPYGDDADECGY